MCIRDRAVRVARKSVVVKCDFGGMERLVRYGFEVKKGNSRKSFYYVGYDLGG